MVFLFKKELIRMVVSFVNMNVKIRRCSWSVKLLWLWKSATAYILLRLFSTISDEFIDTSTRVPIRLSVWKVLIILVRLLYFNSIFFRCKTQNFTYVLFWARKRILSSRKRILIFQIQSLGMFSYIIIEVLHLTVSQIVDLIIEK